MCGRGATRRYGPSNQNTMALQIINALATTTSRLEKEAILKQNCTNLALKEAFRQIGRAHV